MPVFGPRETSIKLLANLNPVKLADLARDILAIRDHNDIRITDGPGDGCRDIHSITSNGETHLTQCKFHADISKSVSSRETGELPLGMVKFGYKQGLFITSARISPQAKREFIDNYPSQTLEYLEGADIVEIVLSDPVLRSIWYDGNRIDHVSYVVRIPFLARDLETGRPIKVSHQGHTVVDNIELPYEENLIACIQDGVLSLTDFEPYRPPLVKSISEGWRPNLNASEFVIRRKLPLDQIARCQDYLASKTLETIVGIHNSNHIAIKYGKAYLIPLHGETSGAKVMLPGSSNTLVSHHEIVSSEHQWLLPSPKKHWFPPDRVTGMTAEWVRWYNPQCDVCLDVNILCVPVGYIRGSIEEQHAFYTQSWMKSIFALFPKKESAVLFDAVNPEPSDIVNWYDGKMLCAWLEWELQPAPFRSMLLEPDDILGSPDEPESMPWSDNNTGKFREQIFAQISSAGGKLVDPELARHMFAIVKQQDPIPSKDIAIHRSVDILTSTDIPSPIAPQDRRIMFTCCWYMAEEAFQESNIDKFQALIQAQLPQPLQIKLTLDTNTQHGEYICCTIYFGNNFTMDSTDLLSERCLQETSPFLDNLETLISSRYPKAKRATRQYWLEEYGVLFATSD